MRSLVLFVILAGSFAFVNAKLPLKPAKLDPKSIELNAFLRKQQVILDVFQHVHQNDTQNKLYADSENVDWTTLGEWYEDPTVVSNYVKRQEIGLLARGEEFSVLKKSHIEEAIALFRLLHQAENWDTFYRVLVWARFHVNEGVFIYASTVAILHRPDMEGIVLPAPYEIYPYYFFSAETIQEAQTNKMQGFPTSKKAAETNELIIESNYTGWNKRSNPEQVLSYFTEDIGLNTWYFYLHADYPFWIDSKDSIFKNRRGEVYLHTHAQLLARYYMERLSNGLGKIPQFSWRVPFRTGYNPALAYYKGSSFPVRNNYYSTYNEETYYSIEKLEGLENRVKFSIDHRFYTLPNGTVVDISKPENIEYFADLYKYTPYKNDSKFFGLLEVLGRTLLGTAIENYSTDDYLPSVLEHFETSLRDPAFYQLYGRLIRYYLQWKTKLEPYTEEEIGFEGVAIEGVELDRLTTYFDIFDADITNAVDIEPMAVPAKGPLTKYGKKANKMGEDLMIKARQWRLNHLPFTLKLTVTSSKVQRASVKVFIGPKFDEAGNGIEINENRENFYEIDKYIVDLKAGRSIITRNSNQFTFYSNDRTTYFVLYKTVMTALSGEATLPADFSQSTCGFPQRLMLPKGKKTGFAVQLFVIITEYRSPSTWVIQKDWFSSSNCRRDIDARPLGFPLDREIDETIWNSPNMKYIETAVYHKSEMDINTTA
ncbi:larval serum protein 1 alpha chain-like [Sitodiplosis mosellana]|uniref:larval serum protein 1 alpha chain-like n=1 Tax=Sitodiplosis mosellana TaxID=263140 RepID=UPI0024437763|nr:larval serum protein 1 alpha chain-like [Sitodiplosis mosellana]